jgi:biotin operon repressor
LGGKPVPEPEPVSIELSEAQVRRVLAGASGVGSLSLALSGLPHAREVLTRAAGLAGDRYMSGSLLSGLTVLAAFPTDGSYIGNAQVARTLGMSLSTVHRYISTLVAVGLLERDPRTRQYRLANAP